MSNAMLTPGDSSAASFSPPAATSSRSAAKPQRVLACVLCQHRKIKCDRKFPCVNCIKASAQCVPATAVRQRQRRRRLPERELLERLRRYEGLLRQNNIKFDHLHTSGEDRASPCDEDRDSDYPDSRPAGVAVRGAGRSLEEKTTAESNPRVHQKKQSRNLEDSEDYDHSDDDVGDNFFPHNDAHEAVVKVVLDQSYESNDHFLFGAHKTNVNLSTLHPQPNQIFRLWQTYLDNVDPLLKVTHTPTLQARIIDVAGDVGNISPALEALMFSIYCVSILSLTDDECLTSFGSPKKGLLGNYRFGCQQALMNSGVLRSSDRDCLTALLLYLISVRPDTDPRSLASMLGAAIRIAQGMGIHRESTYVECTALEAEMGRRLWWSLIRFDNRVCQMLNYKNTMLLPTWNCRTPLNVNDFDIRPEMKAAPASHDRPTEALFVVVNSEIGDFLRHSATYLEFTNPLLKTVAKNIRHDPGLESEDMLALEKRLEDKHLRFCNPENPLHFLTIWTTRGYIGKNRLLKHYSKYSKSSLQQTDVPTNAAICHAISMLECDTKLLDSPLIKGYLWHIVFHFPFPAYIHIIHDLTKRPIQEYAEKAWEAMSGNFQARFRDKFQDDIPLFEVFSKMVLQAWEAREVAFKQTNQSPSPSPIVTSIKCRLAQMTSGVQHIDMEQPGDAMNTNTADSIMPTQMDFGGNGLQSGMGPYGSLNFGSQGYPDIFGQGTMDTDVSPLDWTTLDWEPPHASNW